MPDFTLTADDLDSAQGAPQQARLVTTGLADTAEAPVSVRKASATHLPAYVPCPQCGGLVLTGATPAGELVALDTQVQSYVPLWLADTVRPTLHASRGYPVHRHGGEI